MANEEQTINPIVNNGKTLDPTTIGQNNFENELQNSIPQQKDSDSWNVSPEVPSNEDFLQWTQNIQQEPQTSFEQNISSENNNLSENLNSAEITESSNNEIILWKFDNPVISTSVPENDSQDLDISLLEHPAILDNSPILKANNEEEQQKANLEQKIKLAQLIKTHKTKAQRIWFTKWILSGIALTIVIGIVWFIFAKDQIIDLINNENSNQQLTANVVDIVNTTDWETISEDEIIIDDTNIEESNEDEENENINNEGSITENENATIEDESIDEETTDENTDDNETIIDENTDEENNYLDEVVSPEDEYTQIAPEDEYTQIASEEQAYTITHVDTPEEANWILPSHCDDLTCYGEDKEFSQCTTFKLVESLDENAHRIGNNWVCRYKDPSELVYVEFK